MDDSQLDIFLPALRHVTQRLVPVLAMQDGLKALKLSSGDKEALISLLMLLPHINDIKAVFLQYLMLLRERYQNKSCPKIVEGRIFTKNSLRKRHVRVFPFLRSVLVAKIYYCSGWHAGLIS